jgi:hypothetical protein
VTTITLATVYVISRFSAVWEKRQQDFCRNLAASPAGLFPLTIKRQQKVRFEDLERVAQTDFKQSNETVFAGKPV